VSIPFIVSLRRIAIRAQALDGSVRTGAEDVAWR
jgi:hypothetical protein